MKFTSNLVGGLASAAGLATVGGYESELEIPPTIIPIVEIPEVNGELVGASGVTRTSLSCPFSLEILNQAGTAGNLFTLDNGLWDIKLFYQYTSNYVLTGTNFGFELLFQDFATTLKIIRMFSLMPAGTATVLHHVEDQLHWRLLIREPYTFRFTANANGAGQRQTIALNFVVNKLLGS